MVSLDKFIDPDLSAEEIQHSSGYVSKTGVGSGAGGLSMEKRLEMSRKTRIVGEYRHSHLGRRHKVGLRARTVQRQDERVYDASSDTFLDKSKLSNRRHGGVKPSQTDSSSIAKRQHFIEPPSRKYNPYG